LTAMTPYAQKRRAHPFFACTAGKNNQIIACDNVYYHNWKQS